MAIDERARHRMYLRLEEVLGREEAATLMQHLPPTGMADVATKQDIALLRRDFEQLEERITLRFEAKLESKISALTRTLVAFMTGLVVAVAGLAFAAARFG